MYTYLANSVRDRLVLLPMRQHNLLLFIGYSIVMTVNQTVFGRLISNLLEGNQYSLKDDITKFKVKDHKPR